jgi:phospholipid/cholesterol/gamma-HCH transport system substrate-binding protein
MGTETAAAGAGAGKAVEATGAEVQRFSAQTLPELQRLMGELSELSAALRRLSEQTERQPESLLFGRRAPAAGPGETHGGEKAR